MDHAGDWAPKSEAAVVYGGGGLFFFVWENLPKQFEGIAGAGRVYACSGDCDSYISSVERVDV